MIETLWYHPCRFSRCWRKVWSVAQIARASSAPTRSKLSKMRTTRRSVLLDKTSVINSLKLCSNSIDVGCGVSVVSAVTKVFVSALRSDQSKSSPLLRARRRATKTIKSGANEKSNPTGVFQARWREGSQVILIPSSSPLLKSARPRGTNSVATATHFPKKVGFDVVWVSVRFFLFGKLKKALFPFVLLLVESRQVGI